MKILIVGKFPPIQGGVSATVFWTIESLLKLGNEIHLVTNASECEFGYKEYFEEEDYLERSYHNNNSFFIHETKPLRHESYIPWSQPYLSKLIGLSLEVTQQYEFDVIIGWYLEPYGVAAGIVGNFTNISYYLVHAGSDIGRLSKNDDLHSTYRFIVNNAKGIFSSGKDEVVRTLLTELGVKNNQLLKLKATVLPARFHSSSKPIKEEIIKYSFSRWAKGNLDEKLYQAICAQNESELDLLKPSIGIYCKVGESKGSYVLLEALEGLSSKGYDFNFFCIASQKKSKLEDFYSKLILKQNLLRQTRILPPLPPWKIPSLLKSCTVTCFLENNFSIEFHTSLIPREIISSNSLLIISKEYVDKLFLSNCFIDSKTCIIIDDPNDIDELQSKIELVLFNSKLTNSIKNHSKYVSAYWENLLKLNNFTLSDYISTQNI